MANPWFRLHAEFAKDPKVQSMDETLQRRFVMLLCLHCSDELAELDDDELAFALHVSDDQLQETRRVFVKKGFIDDDWTIRNWDYRQFQSDNSAERTRAYRKRKAGSRHGDGGVTSPQRHSDDDVTPPDNRIQNTDNDPPLPSVAPPLAGGATRSTKNDQPKDKPAKKTSMPTGFELTDRMRENAIAYWAKCNRWDLDPDAVFAEFYTHYDDKREQRREDWAKTWCTWYTKAVRINPRPANGKYNGPNKPGSNVERLIAEREERERREGGTFYEHDEPTKQAPH